jgi:hypothetical protein
MKALLRLMGMAPEMAEVSTPGACALTSDDEKVARNLG